MVVTPAALATAAGEATAGERRLDDHDDLRRWLAGDATAFAALVDRHQAPLLRHATRLLRDAARAEDAVQETFLRLVREARALRGEPPLAAWLFHVCRNLCLDVARKEGRMQERHLRVAVQEQAPPEPVPWEQSEERARVRALLAELPEHEREVLTLKVLDGKSFREIQALLGTSLHDVFTTAHRALRKLAAGLRTAGLA